MQAQEYTDGSPVLGVDEGDDRKQKASKQMYTYRLQY